MRAIALLVISIVLVTNVNAETERYFKISGSKYLITPELLKAVAKVESNFHNFAIGITIKDRLQISNFFKKNKIKTYKLSKRRASVFPENISQALKVIKYAKLKKHDYDIGLMQINKYNIERRNLDIKKLLTNKYYNVDIGAKILKECADRNVGNVIYSLECYNKGLRKKLYNGSYAKKVIVNYLKILNNR
jgi:soluble lytic murein transglycosylase-like protein